MSGQSHTSQLCEKSAVNPDGSMNPAETVPGL